MSISDFENLRSRYLQCLPSVQHRVFNEGKVIRDKKIPPPPPKKKNCLRCLPNKDVDRAKALSVWIFIAESSDD